MNGFKVIHRETGKEFTTSNATDFMLKIDDFFGRAIYLVNPEDPFSDIDIKDTVKKIVLSQDGEPQIFVWDYYGVVSTVYGLSSHFKVCMDEEKACLKWKLVHKETGKEVTTENVKDFLSTKESQIKWFPDEKLYFMNPKNRKDFIEPTYVIDSILLTQDGEPAILTHEDWVIQEHYEGYEEVIRGDEPDIYRLNPNDFEVVFAEGKGIDP